MMRPWCRFINERFPLPIYGTLTLGMSVSSQMLLSEGINFRITTFSVLGLVLFFLTLRVMDEYKDYQKDLVAHPERPLPRGLISVASVCRAINFLLVVMISFAFISYVMFGLLSCFLYLVITGYLFLMFREFFMRERLAQFPFVYALTHQVILFPLIAFVVSLVAPSVVFTKQPLLFAAATFFAFFTYEISRKLDPKAPAILGTYLVVSGSAKTAISLIFLIAAGMVISFMLFGQWYFAFGNVAVLCTLGLFFVRSQLFRWVEITASISLFLHLWSVGLWRWFLS